MKISIKKLYFVFLFVLPTLILLQECSPAPQAKPDCLKPGMENLKIRWGQTVIATGEIRGYEMDSGSRLYSIYKKDKSEPEKSSPAGVVTADDFCRSMQMVRHQIIKIQALNAPGDTSRFIEFSSPGTNMNFFGIWNPAFSTVANKGFAAAYDSLMLLVR